MTHTFPNRSNNDALVAQARFTLAERVRQILMRLKLEPDSNQKEDKLTHLFVDVRDDVEDERILQWSAQIADDLISAGVVKDREHLNSIIRPSLESLTVASNYRRSEEGNRCEPTKVRPARPTRSRTICMSLRRTLLLEPYQSAPYVVSSVAKEFDCSQRVASLALSRLARWGLLTYTKRGIYHRPNPLSKSELVDFGRKRFSIELQNVRDLALATPTKRRALRKIHKGLKSLVGKEHGGTIGSLPLAFIDWDLKFHIAVAHLSGNAHTVDAIRRLYYPMVVNCPTFRKVVKSEGQKISSRIDEVSEEHEELIEAIDKNNLPRAALALVDHFLGGMLRWYPDLTEPAQKAIDSYLLDFESTMTEMRYNSLYESLVRSMEELETGDMFVFEAKNVPALEFDDRRLINSVAKGIAKGAKFYYLYASDSVLDQLSVKLGAEDRIELESTTPLESAQHEANFGKFRSRVIEELRVWKLSGDRFDQHVFLMFCDTAEVLPNAGETFAAFIYGDGRVQLTQRPISCPKKKKWVAFLDSPRVSTLDYLMRLKSVLKGVRRGGKVQAQVELEHLRNRIGMLIPKTPTQQLPPRLLPPWYGRACSTVRDSV